MSKRYNDGLQLRSHPEIPTIQNQNIQILQRLRQCLFPLWGFGLLPLLSQLQVIYPDVLC